MRLEKILKAKRHLNLKQRLLRKRNLQKRRKPDANIWYSCVIKGERVFMFGKSNRYDCHITFRPVKLHGFAGYSETRKRFEVRPILDFGIGSIGWRKESRYYFST